MFWSNMKEKIKRIENLGQEIEILEREFHRLKKLFYRLDRIMKYSEPKKITYCNYPSPDCRDVCIYKDGEEYIISGLLLYNAKIDQIGLPDNLVRVKDEYKKDGTIIESTYLVDLHRNTFIKEG